MGGAEDLQWYLKLILSMLVPQQLLEGCSVAPSLINKSP